ncbi:MAG: chloride channel protein [Elusimicrobiaceae bacterium]|nr:chloride channel protein [Elusimicrobiaceae bacterium]
MINTINAYSLRLVKHRYGITFAAYVASAFVTGIVCVAFMRAFAYVDTHRLDYAHIGLWCLIAAPLLFSLAVALITLFAPGAAGSGIPQAIYVVRHGHQPGAASFISGLTSPQTMAVKVLSILIGVWGGASVGREGPTVQIAVCTLFLCMSLLAKVLPISPNPRSLALAGGAAGLAAAFNTPLAGVTFALEELSSGYFESIKDYVLMAIIVAALSAKVMTGDYIYFGKLPDPPNIQMSAIIFISIIAGVAGNFFSKAILSGADIYAKFAQSRWRYLFPALCALAVISLAQLGGPFVLGPGNGAAQNYLSHSTSNTPAVFPLAKFAATVLTYWSGVAGGIFAPSLSIGASIGAEIARVLHYPISSCALVGMSAFLSGAILAPMTSFVIIFELTGHHSMLLPIMLASLIAYMVVRSLGARSLYAALADRYPEPPK